MARPELRILALFGLALCAMAQTKHGDEDGFTDTPLLPGSTFHVHDPARPHPPVVMPGGQPGAPPSDAVILFDGKDLSHWTASKLGRAAFTSTNARAPWKVGNGYFEVAPGAGDIATREQFGDVQLHIEWSERPV